MQRTLAGLDNEWGRLVRSPEARRAFARWRATFPVLDAAGDLEALVARRKEWVEWPAILRALASIAPSDLLAARAVLQSLLPGLWRMAVATAPDDPNAVEEMTAIAWLRIRTYPPTRRGSVAANVIWDTRKRYRSQHRGSDLPRGLDPRGERAGESAPSAEEVFVGRVIFEELATAESAGVISADTMRLIMRTRVDGDPLREIAAEQRAPYDALNHRRWRAERQLRRLALAG